MDLNIVAELRRIADQDIGGNAPGIADDLHRLASRLATEMEGGRPPGNGKCRLDDDGIGEIIAIEAGDQPQALWLRPGIVYDRNVVRAEPGIWITYQEHYMHSGMTGPVLLTPRVWHQLTRAVNSRLSDQLIGVREAAARIGVHENTVRNWRKLGIIQSAKVTPAGYHRYAPHEVERLRVSMQAHANQ